MIGNRVDLTEDRVVQKEEALALVQELGLNFHFETSARLGMNIEDLFTRLAKHIYIEN